MSTMEKEVLAELPACDEPLAATRAPPSRPSPQIAGAVVGTLIGFKDEGCTALVLFPGQCGSAAVAAAATVEVHGSHIGRQVALIFEKADPRRPIIVGVLRGQQAWPLSEQPGQVEIDADGQHLTVTAKEQLVRQCGKASITLTKAGKVLIRGAHVSSRSSGVLRIKGGSVEIN
jgi:hypothetical protein